MKVKMNQASKKKNISHLINLTPSQNKLLAGEKNQFFAQIKLTAPKRKNKRESVDIAFVIDCSSSMGRGPGSAKAEAAKACRFAIERLQGEDRVSLVVYGNNVLVLSELTNDHQSVLKELDQLPDLGMTALADGLFRGLETLGSEKNHSQQLFLLSDGLANVGITDSEQIVSRLQSVSTKVSTFGLGISYDEDLLEAIANNSLSGYHFLANADEAPVAFQEELADIFSVSIINASIQVTAHKVDIKNCYGLEINKNKIKFGDLASTASRIAILELETAELAKDLSLLDVVLTYQTSSGDLKTQKTNLQMSVTTSESAVEASINEDVLNAVYEMEAAHAQQQAALAADKGQFNVAREIVKKSINSIGQFKSRGYQLSASLAAKEQELFNNSQTVSSSQTYNSFASKSLKSDSYKTRTSR